MTRRNTNTMYIENTNGLPSKSYLNNHAPYCDCFDCTPDYIQELLAKSMKPYMVNPAGKMDYAEVVSKPASYYFDSTLVAKVPVTARQSPDDTAPVVQTFTKGTNVGVIQDYVVRNGQVWWDVNWFSGSHMGWIKHDPALFDASIAEQTASGAVQAATVAKLNTAAAKPASSVEAIADATTNATVNAVTGAGNFISGAGDLLTSLGGNLKWIALAVVLLVVILAFMRYAPAK